MATQDPLAAAGARELLRPHAVDLVGDEHESPQVVLVVADDVDTGVQQLLRDARHTGAATVLVVPTPTDQTAVTAAGCGVTGLIPRAEVTSDHLLNVIQAVAKGDGHMPPHLVGALLTAIGRSAGTSSMGQIFLGLSDREASMLRLFAEGYSTENVAEELAYSPRMVKNILRDVTLRYQLRNRTHAVAFAIRQGLI
ncbi:response regulator transcription factor [Streptomyces sp. NPDC015350]|uniref:helix-turn-helix transcriptional regulator n=1 Tax=Streptomyces sp. NPDC015350 TaxID=3364955 RepID=UPI0037030DC9